MSTIQKKKKKLPEIVILLNGVFGCLLAKRPLAEDNFTGNGCFPIIV